MRTKKEIVENWLPRYTGTAIENFGKYILLVNFGAYLETFARLNNVEILGSERSMPSATAGNITMIKFGMGSANAATVMDLLSAISWEITFFLLQPSEAKEHLTIISHPKSRLFLHLICKKPSLPPSVIWASTIIQAQFIQPTAVFGNTTMNSRNIFRLQGLWPLTSKRPPSLLSGSPILFPQGPCYWCPTSL